MKRIDSIRIKNIKGIEDKSFDLHLIPDKPSILVAPNGFGKSSIATAFNSLNNRHLVLDPIDCYKNDETLKPELELDIISDSNSKQLLKADEDSNSINSTFDIFVINNQLKANSVKKNQGRFTSVTTTLEVEPVVLIDKIVNRTTIQYSIASTKRSFGSNGKILPNIEDVLVDNKLITLIYEKGTLDKFRQVKVERKLSKIKEISNGISGNRKEILSNLEINYLAEFKLIPYIDEYVKILKDCGHNYEYQAEYFLAAFQIIEAYMASTSNFKKVVKYATYELEKINYLEIFKSFNSTWQNLKPVEDKRNGFVLKFPNAKLISNGERDVLSFLALLLKARHKFRKDYSILIIDEVFDYLDDANLIACQFYVTKMIQELKDKGKHIFPLIMTHLNPLYFKNFVFSNQKVYFLQEMSGHINKEIEKVILTRDNKETCDDFYQSISAYFLHYHPDIKDEKDHFIEYNLASGLNTSEKFTNLVIKELEKYIAERGNYDPLAVCSAVRILIEQKAYNLISIDCRTDFLETHTTLAKLNFARENGANIPETFYLLSLIYNVGLHIKKNEEYAIPILSKLSNLTIKQMIKSLM